jgi:hypothetical protein
MARPGVRAYRRAMPLYLVSRRRAWLSEEELAATVDCAPAVLDTFGGDIRHVRSYVFAEPDGSFSAECVYEATSAERLEAYADAMLLPADEIRAVHAVT